MTFHLTPRERQVLDLLQQDIPLKTVADQGGMTDTAVSNTLLRLRKKFDARTTHGMLLKAVKMGEPA